MGQLIFLIGILVISSCIEGATITISNTIINITDERFVSFTIDTSQLFHSNFNLSSDEFIYLAKELGPSYLRVGGTQSDYTYYQVGDEDPCHLPSDNYHCLSMDIFENLIDFAGKIDAKLVFGLSFGYPTYPTPNTTNWNSSNTEQFLQYLKDKGYNNSNIYGFELGNELNQGEPYKVPTVQANGLRKLRGIIDDIFGQNNGIKLFGPDPHSYTLRENQADFDYIVNYIIDVCDILDGMTYHCYINQNQTQILTSNGLNEQFRESSRISNIWNYPNINNQSKHCQELANNIWAGEIAEHNNGGIINLTNTFYDGFWYLDALGTISNINQKVFARQTFADSNYGLLNHQFLPNCDYYTAYLFNQLMSTNIIKINSDDENFRVYAHCAKNGTNNALTIAFINIKKKETKIDYDSSLLSDPYIWSLTPGDSTQGLSSETMSLNGNLLTLSNDGKLPNLNGKKIDQTTSIKVPGYSYGFLKFDTTQLSVCQ